MQGILVIPGYAAYSLPHSDTAIFSPFLDPGMYQWEPLPLSGSLTSPSCTSYLIFGLAWCPPHYSLDVGWVFNCCWAIFLMRSEPRQVVDCSAH